MKTMLCWGLVALLGLAGMPPAWAAPTLEAVSAALANPAVLRGQFSQAKQVTGFVHPLRSTGQFVVARDKGVIWQTDTPFASSLVVTASQIRSRQADGRMRVEVDASQQPAMRSVNTVLFALISGDLQALDRLFHITPVAPAGQGWQLRLTPRSRMLGRAFSQLNLQGDRYVRHVEIVEASGDRTQIDFAQVSEQPGQLRQDEARHFD